MAIVEFLW